MIEYIEFENIRKLAMNASYNNSTISNNKVSFRDINIICGKNGSGKSTVLDMIRAIDNDDILRSLPRENMDNNSVAKLLIRHDGKDNIYEFRSIGIQEHDIKIVRENGFKFKVFYYNQLDKVSCETFVEVINESNFLHDKLLGFYKDPLKDGTFSYRKRKNSDRENLDDISLNKIKYPIVRSDESNVIDIHLNDDEMYNSIHYDYIPSGWKQIAGIIDFVKNKCGDGDIFLIDEPESHLHPEFQRILIEQIIDIRKQKNLQIFIATHSTIFMDPLMWEEANSLSLLISDGYGISDFTNPTKLLSELGIKASDMFQAEGIIWVEGPSDRIYIKHWLELYAKTTEKRVFKENFHFSFFLYGGALMKYYSEDPKLQTPSDIHDTILINKINKNSLFVFDKDMGDEKYKNSVINSKIDVLSTSKYTIEDYLPRSFFNKYFTVKDGRTKIKGSKSKVNIAQEFCFKEDADNDFNEMFRENEFKNFIERIYNEIDKWNCI